MSFCWYCYWGWPKETADIYDAAIKQLGTSDLLSFGPSHIVWEDENFETEHIQYCIEECKTYKPGEHDAFKHTPEQLKIIQDSLEKLLAVPEYIRCCEPAAHRDTENAQPEDFPPPPGITMIRK